MPAVVNPWWICVSVSGGRGSKQASISSRLSRWSVLQRVNRAGWQQKADGKLSGTIVVYSMQMDVSEGVLCPGGLTGLGHDLWGRRAARSREPLSSAFQSSLVFCSGIRRASCRPSPSTRHLYLPLSLPPITHASAKDLISSLSSVRLSPCVVSSVSFHTY